MIGLYSLKTVPSPDRVCQLFKLLPILFFTFAVDHENEIRVLPDLFRKSLAVIRRGDLLPVRPGFCAGILRLRGRALFSG